MPVIGESWQTKPPGSRFHANTLKRNFSAEVLLTYDWICKSIIMAENIFTYVMKQMWNNNKLENNKVTMEI